MSKQVYLSPSALNVFNDCPRCFWLDKNKRMKQPRGIFPSLPSGMDKVLKARYDLYRERKEMPPELAGKVRGVLFDDAVTLTRWRSWRSTDLKYIDTEANAVLSGALDDCLVDGDLFIPFDAKTNGYGYKPGGEHYYQTQLDCYELMLLANGRKTCGEAYLGYYSPVEIPAAALTDAMREKHIGVWAGFRCEPILVKTNPEAAKKLVREAAECLSGPMPDPDPECVYCGMEIERRKL